MKGKSVRERTRDSAVERFEFTAQTEEEWTVLDQLCGIAISDWEIDWGEVSRYLSTQVDKAIADQAEKEERH